LLAIVGIYAVVSYSVGQRRPEIAVRLALGAEPRDIVMHILGQGFRLAAVGVLHGIGISIMGAPLIRSLLFDIAPLDLPTLVSATALVVCVVLIACYRPAARAAATDPARALRGETA
jgi:ABC-type antimicrobial peptide transport system permease subunit